MPHDVEQDFRELAARIRQLETQSGVVERLERLERARADKSIWDRIEALVTAPSVLVAAIGVVGTLYTIQVGEERAKAEGQVESLKQCVAIVGLLKDESPEVRVSAFELLRSNDEPCRLRGFAQAELDKLRKRAIRLQDDAEIRHSFLDHTAADMSEAIEEVVLADGPPTPEKVHRLNTVSQTYQLAQTTWKDTARQAAALEDALGQRFAKRVYFREGSLRNLEPEERLAIKEVIATCGLGNLRANLHLSKLDDATALAQQAADQLTALGLSGVDVHTLRDAPGDRRRLTVKCRSTAAAGARDE